MSYKCLVNLNTFKVTRWNYYKTKVYHLSSKSLTKTDEGMIEIDNNRKSGSYQQA